MKKALLLCAGFGTRLRPITETTPKCLVKIGGQPLLDIWINTLVQNGIEQILINTHYLAKQVLTFVAEHKYRTRIKIVNEPQLLGTAATIRKNNAYFDEGPFLIAHADNLSVFNFSEFLDVHKKRCHNVDITMMTFKSEDPKSCGIVTIDKNNIVQEFFEKVPNPPGNIANGAVYIFEKSVIDFMVKHPESFDISRDVLPSFTKKIVIYKNRHLHVDIGTPSSLRWGTKRFLSKRQTYNGILGVIV